MLVNATAVEYYCADWNYYFETALLDAVRKESDNSLTPSRAYSASGSGRS